MVPIFRTVLRTGKVTIPWLEIVLTSIIGALYPCLFIKLKNATPGKLLFRLKIVDYETGSDRLTWAQVLLRVSAEYALTPLFSLGPMAVAFFREDRRHLIDIIARTRVVQDSPRRKKAEIRRILGTILVLYFGVGALYKLLGHKSYNYTREGLVMSLPRSPARK